MAQGCLAALFGIGVQRGSSGAQAPSKSSAGSYPGGSSAGANEGDIHSGPGGYEGMGYAGGYAADYFDDDDEGDFRHEH